MMKALYSGVSGLKTHQVKMDVIGNNIANVNTLAYKSSSITFSELMYQTTQNATGADPTSGRAGINARQIGLGVQSSAINTNITAEGSPQTTGNPFDIKITGDSFFVVNDGNTNYFTRAGAFYVDGMGNLAMTSNGYNVMGWGLNDDKTAIKPGTVQPLRVMHPDNKTYPAEATTKAFASGIVDKLDTSITSSGGKVMNLEFYDSKGFAYTAKLSMKLVDENGNYTVQLVDVMDSNNKSVMDKYPGLSMGVEKQFMAGGPPLVATPKKSKPDGVTYHAAGATVDGTVYPNATYQIGTGTPKDIATLYDPATGKASADMDIIAERYGYDTVKEFMDSYIDADGEGAGVVTAKMSTLFATGATGFIALMTNAVSATNSPDGQLTFTGFTGATVEYETGSEKFKSINGNANTTSVVLNFGAYDNFKDITVDFSLTTEQANGGKATVAAAKGDVKDPKLGTGRKTGKLEGIGIDGNGVIYATYSNGMSRLLGQIAVAQFSNPSGLMKAGDNLYSATQNSGDFDGSGVDIGSADGFMTTGVLEMSNVDLSGEFTEMITTQRGFQANSRIITVSDTMLEELVNLKR